MPGQSIKNKLITILPEIFKGKPVLFAYLFGSVATEQAQFFSDLDVAIYVEPGYPAKDRLSLEMSLGLEIDAGLESDLSSDVRILNYLPLAIAGQVVTHGILVFCRDDNARIDYEVSTRTAYFDFLPVLRKIQREHIQQIMTN